MPGRRGADREPSETRSALVQFEALRREFQVVLDGQQGVMRRLDQVEARVEKSHEDLKTYLMDGLKKAYGDLEIFGSRLKHVEGRSC